MNSRRAATHRAALGVVCRPMSVAEAAVKTLIRAFETGRLQTVLPGERKLCAMLQISRMTLRLALKEVERLGWVRNVPGQVREILRPAKFRERPGSSRSILYILPSPVRNLEPFFVLSLDHLREMLGRQGILLQTHIRPECYGPNFRHALKRLCAEHHPDLWLLGRSSRTMQAWFLSHAHKHLVLGSAFASKFHSAVDLDHVATARHAAMTFARLGHTRLAVFIRNPRLAGDQQSLDGFLAAATTQAGSPLQAEAFVHDGTPSGIFRAVDRLVKLSPRPTAIYSAAGLPTISIMTRLTELRIRVPHEMSIISRDDDPALDFITPAPARYSRSSEKFARIILRQIQRLLMVRAARPHTSLIYPEFLRKATLAPPPAG